MPENDTPTEGAVENDAAARQARFAKLVQHDLPAQGKRLKRLQDEGELTTERLGLELHSTILPFLEDIGGMALEIGASSGAWLTGLTDHLEAVDERVSSLELVLSGETQIDSDHAKMLLIYIEASNTIFKKLLEQQDTTGKTELRDHIALGEQCAQVVTDHRMEEDDDDEDDEGDDDTELPPIDPPAAADAGPS